MFPYLIHYTVGSLEIKRRKKYLSRCHTRPNPLGSPNPLVYVLQNSRTRGFLLAKIYNRVKKSRGFPSPLLLCCKRHFSGEWILCVWGGSPQPPQPSPTGCRPTGGAGAGLPVKKLTAQHTVGGIRMSGGLGAGCETKTSEGAEDVGSGSSRDEEEVDGVGSDTAVAGGRGHGRRRMSGCRGGWSSRCLEIPPAYHGLRLWVAS